MNITEHINQQQAITTAILLALSATINRAEADAALSELAERMPIEWKRGYGRIVALSLAQALEQFARNL
jgi:hypothetical protein